MSGDWHYASGVCTNAPLTSDDVGTTDSWSSLRACCYVSTGSSACEYADVCSPDYAVPATPTPVATVSTGVPSKSPSRCDPTAAGEPCTASPVTQYTITRDPTPVPTAEAPIAPNGEPFPRITPLPTGGSSGIGIPPEFTFSTPGPTPCGHPFYVAATPGPAAGGVCRNEPLDDYRGVAVYETAEECCSAAFKEGRCTVDDYCLPPCESTPPEIKEPCRQPTTPITITLSPTARPIELVGTDEPTPVPAPTKGPRKSEIEPTPCVPVWGSGVVPASVAGKSGKTKNGGSADLLVTAYGKTGKTKGDGKVRGSYQPIF